MSKRGPRSGRPSFQSNRGNIGQYFLRSSRSDSADSDFPKSNIGLDIDMGNEKELKDIKESISTLTKSIGSLETTLKSQIETIRGNTDKIQLDLVNIRSEINEMKAMSTNTESRVEIVESRLDIALKEMEVLKTSFSEKVNSIKNDILLKEIHDRKSDLLLYGIEEKDNENTEDVV